MCTGYTVYIYPCRNYLFFACLGHAHTLFSCSSLALHEAKNLACRNDDNNDARTYQISTILNLFVDHLSLASTQMLKTKSSKKPAFFPNFGSIESSFMPFQYANDTSKTTTTAKQLYNRKKRRN